MQRAVEAGRGLSGTLHVAFVGAAAAQLLTGATQLFRDGAPDCEVRVREAQPAEILPWLRAGEVDLGLSLFPVHDADIACGPVLVREARMLAVSVGHPFARRQRIPIEDLTRVPVVRLPDHGVAPLSPPSDTGPDAATFQEALTLVGAGQGVFPVGAHARRYYPRPDIAYVPLSGLPPLEWGLLWPSTRATARVHAFATAAHTLISTVA